MKFSRTTTNRIRFFFDYILPPVLRDSRLIMAIPIRLAFKKDADLIMNFKQRALTMTDKELEQVYNQLEWYMDERETDLNPACTEAILQAAVGKTAVDVGCGRGYLAGVLAARKLKVTGVDIVISNNTRKKYPNVRFQKAAIEKLPFPAKAFDTVVCTHTLEHIRDFTPALRELRRITKKRLIIVVPKQRPYRYTFDAHLHFFPYPFMLQQALQPQGPSECRELDGDLFYIEDRMSWNG